MSAGSCCPSSSIVTIQSPLEDAMPASVAGCWPKLRLSHTGRMKSCVLASSRMTSSERSGPWSFTRSSSMTWNSWPAAVRVGTASSAISLTRAASVHSPW